MCFSYPRFKKLTPDPGNVEQFSAEIALGNDLHYSQLVPQVGFHFPIQTNFGEDFEILAISVSFCSVSCVHPWLHPLRQKSGGEDGKVGEDQLATGAAAGPLLPKAGPGRPGHARGWR